LDARRFRTAAVHYTAGRPPYPRALIEDVAGLCGFTREHRLLDLGTGPGMVAIAFAPYVGSVLAVDPEPEMLRIAREAVRAVGVAVEVREGSSETLEPAWGQFRAVTLGRSFHWMDRASTLRRLDGLLEPKGAVILFDDELADTPENEAVRAWWAVIERYSADDPVRAARRAPEWQDHEAVLRASAFSQIDRLLHLDKCAVTVEGLIHRALSMSSTSASRLGPRTEAMVADIQAALAPFAATGEMVEPMEWTAIVARRPVPERRGLKLDPQRSTQSRAAPSEARALPVRRRSAWAQDAGLIDDRDCVAVLGSSAQRALRRVRVAAPRSPPSTRFGGSRCDDCCCS
jgi:SAM-dependent methyltransferase